MSASVQTFLAVVLGAVLATVGGFAATQAAIWVDRARRARSAALLCGELLAAIGTLLGLAEAEAVEGSVLDPVPSRLLQAARREIDVYDRNREMLFSLADADLRARIHGLVVRLSIPLDRLADGQVRHRQLAAATPHCSEQADALRREIDGAFGYLMTSRLLIPDLLQILAPLAGNRLDSYGRLGADGVPSGSAGP